MCQCRKELIIGLEWRQFQLVQKFLEARKANSASFVYSELVASKNYLDKIEKLQVAMMTLAKVLP